MPCGEAGFGQSVLNGALVAPEVIPRPPPLLFAAVSPWSAHGIQWSPRSAGTHGPEARLGMPVEAFGALPVARAIEPSDALSPILVHGRSGDPTSSIK
jgi:hypothetical protein